MTFRFARALRPLLVVAAVSLFAPGTAAAQSFTCPPFGCTPPVVVVGHQPYLQLVTDGGFEQPYATFPNSPLPIWLLTSGLPNYTTRVAHCGTHAMNLMGNLVSQPATASQQINVPSNITYAYL